VGHHRRPPCIGMKKKLVRRSSSLVFNTELESKVATTGGICSKIRRDVTHRDSKQPRVHGAKNM
jgi:hypothetical protein